jgi:hypothetical protein
MAGPPVDWWKQQSPLTEPGAQGLAADWYWLDINGFPARMMFWYQHDGLPAILGDYAYTSFYEFKPGNSVELKAIYDRCVGQQDLPVISATELANFTTAQPASDINPSDLIPGLSYSGCQELNAQPPSWPVELYLTSFSTAAKFGTPKPFPTSVHYQPDAPLGPRIRTRLNKDVVYSDALLAQESSYGVDTLLIPPFNQTGCGAGPHTSLPGGPQPQWGAAGSCQCFGVIQNNPVLSPNRNTQLIGCPLPLVATQAGEQEGNTLFWTWYTIEEPPRPVVFMQTKPDITVGTGLSLADYVYWQPETVADDVFTVPAADSCVFPPPQAPTAPQGCLTCHLASTNTGP